MELAIVEVLIMSAIAAGTFFLGGTGDEDFSQLSPAAKQRFTVGMTLAVLGVIRSFLSTTVATLKKGGTLPPDLDGNGNGTATWTRRQTQTDSATVTGPAQLPKAP